MRLGHLIAAVLIVPLLTSWALADKVIDSGNVAREGTITTIDNRGVVLKWSLTNSERAFRLEQIKSISIDGDRSLEQAEEALAEGRGARAVTLYEAAARKSGKPWVKEYAAARLVQAYAVDGKLSESVKTYIQLMNSGSHLAAQVALPQLGDAKSPEAEKALALIEKALGSQANERGLGWLKQVKAAVLDARRQADRPEVAAPPAPSAPEVEPEAVAVQPEATAAQPEAAERKLFPLVQGRMSPVPPDEPISDEVLQLFNEFYAADVARVLGSADFADNVAVARVLYDAALRRASHPSFAAYVLDHVVYLSSISPEGLSLAYDALHMQYDSKMRGAGECLNRMMELAPSVIASLEREQRSDWVVSRLSPDVQAWFAIQREADNFSGALSLSARLQTACKTHLEAVPAALSTELELIEAQSGYQLALQHCWARVGEEGQFPRENLFVGIHILTVEQDASRAASHLLKSGHDEGLRLAESLAGANASGSSSLEVATAIAALAETYEQEISKALLWRAAVSWLKKSIDAGNLSDVDALRADMLKERYQQQALATSGKLPPVVSEEPVVAGVAAGAGGSGGAAAAGHTFFGITTKSPQSVVFIVDRSGSMTDSFGYLKEELVRSIMELKETDKFYVIFYSSGPGVEMPSRKLVPGTAANKSEAVDFVNSMLPLGQTDPSDALDKAFRQRPDTIHLLTDGEFAPSIPALISRLNRDKKVVVNTIGFLYTMGEELCKEIAHQNGGVYKYVSLADIRKEEPAAAPTGRRRRGDTTAAPAATIEPPPPPPVPPGPPLPAEELARLERMIGVLEDRRVCQGCKGNPETIKRESVPADLWGRRRIVTTTVICSSCRGTGLTSSAAMRPTLTLVREILNKYGSSVPAGVRARAVSAMSSYK